jgi:hypothetical protein
VGLIGDAVFENEVDFSMSFMSAAGLPLTTIRSADFPLEVIRMATLGGAEFLGVDGARAQIAPIAAATNTIVINW